MVLKEYLRLQRNRARAWGTEELPQQTSSLLSPWEQRELKDTLPEVGSQVELWSKGFVDDNRGANADSLDRDDVRTAVLYEQVHLVLELLSVI